MNMQHLIITSIVYWCFLLITGNERLNTLLTEFASFCMQTITEKFHILTRKSRKILKKTFQQKGVIITEQKWRNHGKIGEIYTLWKV